MGVITDTFPVEPLMVTSTSVMMKLRAHIMEAVRADFRFPISVKQQCKEPAVAPKAGLVAVLKRIDV